MEQTKLERHKDYFRLAEKEHKERLIDAVKPFENYLDNKIPSTTDDPHQAYFNHFFINIRKQVPELLGELNLRIKPARNRDTIQLDEENFFDNKKACLIADNKVNDLFSKMQVKYDLKACVYDLLKANFCAMLVGNNTEITESMQVPDEMNNLMAEKAMLGEMIPGESPLEQPSVESVGRNEVVIKRVPYKDTMVDPESVEFFFNDKGYAFRIVRLSKDEAMSVSPEFEGSSYETDKKDTLNVESAKRYRMFEVYDYTGEKVIRTQYVDKFKKEIGEQSFNYDPLLFCKLNFLPDVCYPKSDMFYYKSAVEESNFYRTVKMNNLDKTSTPKVFAEKNAIDAENKEKVANDIAFDIVDVDTKGRGLQGSYQVETFKINESDMSEAIDRATSDIREIAGVNNERFKAGNTPATNATISNNAFLSGVAERKAIIADYMCNVIRSVVEVLKEISIAQETFTYEQPNGVKEEITWSNKDIEHIDYEVVVSLDTSVPDGVKLASVRDFANWVTQPNIYMGLNAEGKKLNFTDLVETVGGYLMPESDLGRLIIDANVLSPEDEMIQLMAGKPVEPTEGEDFNKHLEAHKNFITTHPIAQTLPPEILQMFDAHIVKTMQMAEQKQSLMQQQGEPMGEGRAVKEPLMGNLTGGVM